MSAVETNQQEESPAKEEWEREEHNNTSADKKRGRSCCGCCCDMRRAVVILSALGILLAIVSVVINHFLLFKPITQDYEGLDDDNSSSDTNKQLDDLLTISIVVAGLSVVGFSLSIIGGIKFNQVFVIVNTIYMPIGFAVNQTFLFSAASDIEGFDYGVTNMIGPLIGIIMAVFVNVSFVKEIHNGTMSEKNYERREKQSCCCV